MSKLINGTYTSQYTLTDPNYVPLYIASGARLTNQTGPALLDILADSTIKNAGFVAATGTTGIGLAAAGDVDLTNASSGFVGGYTFGVSIGGTGTVLNQGSIAASQSVGPGISYAAHQLTALTAGVALGGGVLTNATNGTITSPLVGVSIGGGGSVVNAGAIIGSNTTASYGVILQGGGDITNQSGGRITAGEIGVLNTYRAGYVTNQGVILGNNGLGIELAGGGGVTNQSNGQIAGGEAGVYIAAQPGTVTNQGLITNFYYLKNTANYQGRTYFWEGIGLGRGRHDHQPGRRQHYRQFLRCAHLGRPRHGDQRRHHYQLPGAGRRRAAT